MKIHFVYFLIRTLYHEIVFSPLFHHINTRNGMDRNRRIIQRNPLRSGCHSIGGFDLSDLNQYRVPVDNMEEALAKLGFPSMDGVTSESLKKAFKTAVVNAHPDKGGSEDDFESILAAYVHLSTMMKRMTGGRDGFQVLNVFDVRQARDDQFTNELNNLVSDVFDHIDSSDNSAFLKDFNEQFENTHVPENERGYEEWFRTHEEEKEQPPIEVDATQWNQMFETNVKQGKPEPTTLILHPEQMAFVSGSTRGAALIPSTGHSFTSEPQERPEYTDLHDAYTSDSTVFDKLPVYQENVRTFDDILKERDMVYTTELDRDLEAISAYEKQKHEEEVAHKKKIVEYFHENAPSVWALRNVQASQSETDSFVKEFK